MYDQHVRFIDSAKPRSLERIEQWADTLTCPLIHIDGTEDWKANANYIVDHYHRVITRTKV